MLLIFSKADVEAPHEKFFQKGFILRILFRQNDVPFNSIKN